MCTSVYAFSNDPFDIRASNILPFETLYTLEYLNDKREKKGHRVYQVNNEFKTFNI